jgi:hypothetical protein
MRLSIRCMKSATVLTALLLLTAVPAMAKGLVRIQQSDGSVKTYSGVVMRLTRHSLSLTSADGASTVVVAGGACAYVSGTQIERCSGGHMTLRQAGVTHPIRGQNLNFYFNLTASPQSLSLTTTKIGPHSVQFVFHTAKGTYVTGNGQLDFGSKM